MAIGQRIYYLEVPGARLRMAPRRARGLTRPARSTQTRVVVDFPKREIRAHLFYSEADAQELLKTLRTGLPMAAMLAALKKGHDAALTQILRGQQPARLRVVHETAPAAEFMTAPAPALTGSTGHPPLRARVEGRARGPRARTEGAPGSVPGSFETAARTEVDGLTIVTTFTAPPILGHPARTAQAGTARRRRTTCGSYEPGAW